MILKKKINIPTWLFKTNNPKLCTWLPGLPDLRHVTTYFAKILKIFYVYICTIIIINHNEELKISAVNYDEIYEMN